MQKELPTWQQIQRQTYSVSTGGIESAEVSTRPSERWMEALSISVSRPLPVTSACSEEEPSERRPETGLICADLRTTIAVGEQLVVCRLLMSGRRASAFEHAKNEKKKSIKI